MQGVLFDLDGTLLDSLGDLAASTNAMLQALSYPQRSIEEVRQFVGNGMPKLVERALPANAVSSDFEKGYQLFRAHYQAHKQDNTFPYPGILELLDKLKNAGMKVGVLTNKAQPDAAALCEYYFGNRVDAVIGHVPERSKKPDPAGVVALCEALDVNPDACILVGDSEVDALTAQNAKMAFIGVTWGFRSADTLKEAGTLQLADTAEVLGEMLL